MPPVAQSDEKTSGSRAPHFAVQQASASVGNRETDGVGERRHSLTDAERERHIKHCGELMELAMQRWYETGDFGHRGEADRWRILMEEAIKSRSPAQVARMEAERGLR